MMCFWIGGGVLILVTALLVLARIFCETADDHLEDF